MGGGGGKNNNREKDTNSYLHILYKQNVRGGEAYKMKIGLCEKRLDDDDDGVFFYGISCLEVATVVKLLACIIIAPDRLSQLWSQAHSSDLILCTRSGFFCPERTVQ